jgi:CheY-specific phosphatase CheX
MPDQLPLEVWITAVEDGLRDVARDGMGHANLEVVSRTAEIPEKMPGAFIPLMSADESVQVGLVSTPDGAQKMARAMLQMGEGETLSQADLADALGEATNILAGFVKRNMQPHKQNVQLGLPLYVNGHLEMTDRVRAIVSHLKMGEIPVAVIVLRAAAYQPHSH